MLQTLILKHANKNGWAQSTGAQMISMYVRAFGVSDEYFGRYKRRNHCAWPTIHGRGYSSTREQAMAAFKAQWLV